MIRGIFFDAAGVFYDRPETTRAFALRLLREHGYASPGEPTGARHERGPAEREAMRGNLSPEAYWDGFLQRRGMQTAAERAEAVRAILAHTHRVYALPGGREALSGLKARGFLLGVITDTMYPLEWKMSWLASVGVADLFDVVACSTELGVHKPDPAIYRNALAQSGLRAAEAAFVGHDARELAGARQLGMATVAVHYDPDAQADYYVDSLLGLLDVPIFQRAGHPQDGCC
jgi:HAD superfamily hydrolase (TIGR01509 family)